ncbi:unnamed protein product [Candidula unifasciata]|uniref:26S proteasome non-ATPase regulatory subunit 5 n=1 Tax=Candidula unifasciata TaxID=100452 RepID=A0A8S3YML8_9EUPU|nr:unnamed protein product [Candidula unifasciata]
MASEAAINALVERLANISIDNKVQALEELKTALGALRPSELRNILPNISVANVFNCLNTQNKSQQTVCCEVLDRMMSTLSASAALENFHAHFLTWIAVPDDSLKALCLHQLSRISREVPNELSQHEDLVLAVAGLLASDNLDVGLAAAAVLTQLGRDPSGLITLFAESVVRKIVVAMEKNDVTRFRVYQVAIDLSAISPQALEATVQSGLLKQLVNETQADDILVQLNAIEMVSDLALSPHGLAFLDQEGVVGRLEEMMTHLSDNPLSGLLLPGLVKFFGGLAKNHPKEVLSRFDHFVRLVLNHVTEGDQNLRTVSVETVGFIASTPEGKLALEKIGNPVTECIQNIGSLIQTGASDLKSKALQAMSHIVHLEPGDQTDELLSLTERWFCTSMTDPFKTVWSIAQQPFTDIRIPAFHLLQSLALTPWGQKLMNNAPGFKEYVLDRATENSKEGKDEKFELVKMLAHSPTAIEILGRPYHVKLMEYYNQGRFFVLAQSEVAMEGDG